METMTSTAIIVRKIKALIAYIYSYVYTHDDV